MYSLTPLMSALNAVVEISKNKDKYLNALGALRHTFSLSKSLNL